MTFSQQESAGSIISSELGIAAVSPMGESGGLVIPASCPSDLHDDPTYGQQCSVSNACGTQYGTYQCGGTCSASVPICTSSPSPIDGGSIDGGWSPFGPCSATVCGTTGIQRRTCTNPAPSNGGAACIGSATQSCSDCCIVDCNQAYLVCTGQTFNDANGCGINNCAGTRVCD